MTKDLKFEDISSEVPPTKKRRSYRNLSEKEKAQFSFLQGGTALSAELKTDVIFLLDHLEKIWEGWPIFEVSLPWLFLAFLMTSFSFWAAWVWTCWKLLRALVKSSWRESNWSLRWRCSEVAPPLWDLTATFRSFKCLAESWNKRKKVVIPDNYYFYYLITFF